MRSPRYPVD